MKTCTKCKVEKEIKYFSIKDGAAGNRDSRCHDCKTALSREKYRLKKLEGNRIDDYMYKV